jgi:hypothetical protein
MLEVVRNVVAELSVVDIEHKRLFGCTTREYSGLSQLLTCS